MIAGRNIVLSQGVFPADQFNTQSISGSRDFIYAVAGHSLYRISRKTREVTHLAGAFNEAGIADGPPEQSRFGAFPMIIAADQRYLYVDEYVDLKIRRVDIQTGAASTLVSGMSSRIGWADGRVSLR
jgi:hypothetical protein